ncbi:ABC transporter substrate-binding protein [Paractinoplanes toevensis]|uniref:Sugar ABC transporter substrate-binding protein n=1 Tax=Paractinoplanes toevensis TaxID=571911 RepID=A0A919T8B8_9ACTN|nr:ABC transporter substrate-binding protein [Actinoplanes toevensis]GIM90718.1 hypothetical protein Ato02nite_025110 [Actinoplanes toevensis]
MRTSIRRSALAASVVAGLAVSACGGGSSDTPAAVNTAGSAPTGVTLTLWHNTADPQALLDLYQKYETASGNTIQLVDVPSATYPPTIQSKWATGERPDLLEWHGNKTDLLALNGANTMLDLSSLAFVAKEGDLAKVAGNIDGKVYAASIGFPSVSGLFYNKQVLAKAGIAAPTSYADLTADCAKLKTAGVTPIYVAGGDGWPPQILAGWNYMAESNVGAAYSDDVNAGRAKVSDRNGPLVAGLKAFDSLRTSGCFNADATTAKWTDSLKALLDGRTAFVAQNSDSISQLDTIAGGDTKKVDDAIGFVGVSATKQLANYAPTVLGTFYAPKTGDAMKERAAADFVDFITGKGYADYVQASGAPPTLSGTGGPQLQGLWQEVQAAYQAGAGLTVISQLPGFNNFGPEVDKLLAGQENPQQTADKMQTYLLQAQAAMGK